MKVKFLSLIVKALLLMLAIIYCLDNPGIVTLTWKKWHVETSLNVVLLFLGTIILVLMVLRWSKHKVANLLRLSDTARYQSLKEGLQSLEKAWTQMILGNKEAGLGFLKKAEGSLPSKNLPKLLRHELEEKTTLPTVGGLQDFTALKTLATLQKLREEKKWHELEKTLETALSSFLKEAWFWKESFLYRRETGNWGEARKALEKCAKYKGFTNETLTSYLSETLYHLALEEKKPLKKLELLQQSFDENPKNTPNTVALAHALKDQKDMRLAKKSLTTNWTLAPNWEIAQTYATLFAKDKSALSQSHAIRELHDLMKNHTTSHICLAISLIRAKLWGEAASIIDAIEDRSAKACLQAVLQAKEHNTDHIPLSDLRKFLATLEAFHIHMNVFE